MAAARGPGLSLATLLLLCLLPLASLGAKRCSDEEQEQMQAKFQKCLEEKSAEYDEQVAALEDRSNEEHKVNN